MNIEDAINFVFEQVEGPALEHPELEQTYKNKVKNTKTIISRMKKIGDLHRYLKRFKHVLPAGHPNRNLYDRFKELGLKTAEDIYPKFVDKFSYYIDDVTVLGDFVVGTEYTSWDIAIFAQTYNTQSGIYLIGDEPNYQAIFVKATFEEGKYPNEWIKPNETLKYFMYSHRGKFKKEYKYNAAIINSHQTNTPIYVFQKDGTRLLLKGIYRYESDHQNLEDESRWFILQKVDTLAAKKPMTDEEYFYEIQKRVEKASQDTPQDRRRRLKEAEEKPEKLSVSSTQYKRNPDVIAEVLERADGVCEQCHQPAPFIRASNLTPFLEVHHKIPLSDGGTDTVGNAIAVCPNCHQKAHYGANVTTVAAGIIIEDGKILIAKRSGNDELAGKWEFPGGKLNTNETPEKALQRELYEELGINVRIGTYFGESIYQYSSGIIRLMTYFVNKFEGKYRLNVHDDIKFVSLNDLGKYDLLPADVPIVNKLMESNQIIGG